MDYALIVAENGGKRNGYERNDNENLQHKILESIEEESAPRLRLRIGDNVDAPLLLPLGIAGGGFGRR